MLSSPTNTTSGLTTEPIEAAYLFTGKLDSPEIVFKNGLEPKELCPPRIEKGESYGLVAATSELTIAIGFANMRAAEAGSKTQLLYVYIFCADEGYPVYKTHTDLSSESQQLQVKETKEYAFNCIKSSQIMGALVLKSNQNRLHHNYYKQLKTYDACDHIVFDYVENLNCSLSHNLQKTVFFQMMQYVQAGYISIHPLHFFHFDCFDTNIEKIRFWKGQIELKILNFYKHIQMQINDLLQDALCPDLGAEKYTLCISINFTHYRLNIFKFEKIKDIFIGLLVQQDKNKQELLETLSRCIHLWYLQYYAPDIHSQVANTKSVTLKNSTQKSNLVRVDENDFLARMELALLIAPLRAIANHPKGSKKVAAGSPGGEPGKNGTIICLEDDIQDLTHKIIVRQNNLHFFKDSTTENAHASSHKKMLTLNSQSLNSYKKICFFANMKESKDASGYILLHPNHSRFSGCG